VRLREAELLGKCEACQPEKGREYRSYAGKFAQTHP
jgi:hypothetical protein